MQYAKHLWTSGPMSSQRRLKVREFNDVITCYLCRGYLINPATVDNCIHSYCRSCIVQHLRHDDFCPQCKSAGGKPISVANLKSDEILRGLIFKLVPGLYQQERERTLHFIGTFKSDDPNEAGLCELEDEFFAPTEAISLSLEYHPALLAACSEEEVPPVRYLQCPAGVTVHHLKRFLRSKYDIDPENRQVEVEVIYEEEVLPNDFTLMDVGYCYSWKRNEPMRFTYRILVHSGSAQDVVEAKSSAVNSEETRGLSSDNPKNVPASPSQKSVRVVDDKLSSRASWDSSLPPPMTYTVFKSKAQECRLSALSSNNNNNNSSNRANRKSSGEKDFDENQLNGGNGPVKVIIARKPSEWRKNSPKRSHSSEEASYVVANDFKSLRSNDLRYSDYTVTSTTSSSSTSKGKQSSAGRAEAAEAAEERHQAPKCDIVVSRPQSQLPPSPSPADDDASFSQLRTASRKSSPPAPSSPKPKNVPKLKIELGSLKTKITIPKPKSADANGGEPLHKKSKHRKYSLEERPTVDKVDLETYVKHIGLKPIEVVTAPEALDAAEKDKYSSDASPMSSSSSTTSSSNGNFLFASSSEISSSSHKKRKKKHSKDPSGKRRKLHAEISSQPADESLKMKVKITAAHVHKAHRAESRKSSSRTQEDFGLPELVAAKADEASRVVAAEDSRADEPTEDLHAPDKMANDNSNKKSSPSVNMSALNQTLSEESLNISNLMIGKRGASGAPEEPTEVSSPGISLFSSPTENLALPPPPQPPLPKPISSIKDIKIPSSPPLPPSLFKTAPLTLTSATPPTASNLSKTPASSGTSLAAKPPPKTDTKPPSPVQPASVHRENHCGAAKSNNVLAKTQSFAVPNPPRSMPSSPRLCALPTSIASAAHKQLGAQLKRSASLDESCVQNALVKQQEKAVRKNAYAVSTAVRLHSGPPKEFPLQKPKSQSPEKSFYSPLSSCSHDLSKRAHLPFATPGAGAPKIGEAFSMYSGARVPTQPALTITTHPKQTAAQQMINFLPYTPLNKPALEIVRITSNQVPADLQPLPPKSTRPAQPPIPLLKIKKPGQQSTATRSPPIARSPPGTATSTAMKTSSCLQQSPPALINMRNTIPLSVAAKAVPCREDAARAVETKTNGSLAHEKPKAPSLRDFRPTSKDGSVEILDLSAGKPQDAPRPAPAPAPAPAAVPTPTSTSIGTSLEAALNKIKQNITSCTVANSLQLSKLAAAKASSEDLQNLHMLSESATSREKIAIGSPSPQKLFEMPKSQQPSVVRQQNASVRSIPNPSALAFRNQPPLSMLAAVASPPSAALQPTVNPPSLAADAKSLSLSAPVGSSPKSPNTPQQTSPRTKKHPSIDQVAANLNMRAAAAEAEASAARAEASAARAASLEESSLVSSTSAAELKSPQPASAAASVAEASSSQVSSSAATTAAPSAAVSTSAVADSAPVSASTTATATASASSPTPTPATPKTSFKSISSLVASTSSTASVVASSV